MFGGGQDPRVIAFRNRVQSDGGTIESIKCLADKVRAFPAQDSGRILFEAFETRVVADGGTTEGRQCTINAINDL